MMTNLLDCEGGNCSHPTARNWIMCTKCELWMHCTCASVPYSKARSESFIFVVVVVVRLIDGDNNSVLTVFEF